MALRLHPTAGLAELERTSGLSRNTVQSMLGQLKASAPSYVGRRVKVPAGLIADTDLGAQAKVLYGLLQAIPSFQGQTGQFTYTSLCAQTRLARNTLKRAIAELVTADWMRVNQEHQLNPIRFTLGAPELLRGQAEASAAERRLKRNKFTGEAIMQEYLTLLIDSDKFTDNARPGFLVNPQTGERLELDRFYPPSVAFEFHGAQHDGATAKYSKAVADAQHFRDLIKAGICLYEGIQLVIIRAKDLSLQGMMTRIGRCMPLRDLAGHEPLIDLLEDASLTYCAAAGTGKNPGG